MNLKITKMENKILKKGDIVSFDLSGKTLSGKVVEMSYGFIS